MHVGDTKDICWAVGVLLAIMLTSASHGSAEQVSGGQLDDQLTAVLTSHGFTGEIEAQFKAQLSRPIDAKRAQLGRFLWFDIIGGLNNDNTCAGCHSPTNGFGDTQSIAIGIENNFIVGPDRMGPRNQRRTPLVVNTAFYPTLMWNSRFAALSGLQKGSRFPLSRTSWWRRPSFHRLSGWR
jgi:cytochrome c peroxidase